MPMFVPCALLIGMTLSEVSKRDLFAIGATGLGVVGIFLFSGIKVATLTIAAGIVLLAFIEPIKDMVKERLRRDDYEMSRRVLPILGAFIIVLALVGSVPLGTNGHGYSADGKLGHAMNQEVPTGEVIALGPGVNDFFKFSFAAQRPLERSSTDQLNTPSGPQYAVVKNGTLDQLSRDYEVIRTWQDYNAIAFTG